MDTRPSYYDYYKISDSKEHTRYRIYSKTECGSGQGYESKLGAMCVRKMYEFMRILKAVFFVHDALLVSPDRLVVWARVWTTTPTVNNIGLYREDRTPAQPTSILRADSIMISTISCLLENIEKIERIEYQIGDYIPYVIKVSNVVDK
jgi:hypothetical protein